MTDMPAGRAVAFGGFFFRTKDPEALGQWYETHLGIPAAPPWKQEPGFAVFAPFAADTDYWPADRTAMVNLRVAGLDALVGQLEGAGIAVERRPDEWDHPEVGRFARIVDPEGNPVELWEPPASAPNA